MLSHFDYILHLLLQPEVQKFLFGLWNKLTCIALLKIDILVMFSDIQGDQKVSMHLIITIQSSGEQRLFDHPVYACGRDW